MATCFVADRIIDGNCISTKDGPTHVFPLYLYPNPQELGLSTERSLNFKSAFLTALSEALGLPQVTPFNPPEGVSPRKSSLISMGSCIVLRIVIVIMSS